MSLIERRSKERYAFYPYERTGNILFSSNYFWMVPWLFSLAFHEGENDTNPSGNVFILAGCFYSHRHGIHTK